MAWVNRKSGYNPGKRHFYEGEVTREVSRTESRTTNRGTYLYTYFLDSTHGNAACGMRPMYVYGYTVDYGKRKYTRGGLSARENVSLLQSNLCAACKKALLEKKPELKALVEQIRMTQL